MDWLEGLVIGLLAIAIGAIVACVLAASAAF